MSYFLVFNQIPLLTRKRFGRRLTKVEYKGEKHLLFTFLKMQHLHVTTRETKMHYFINRKDWKVHEKSLILKSKL